MSKVVTIKHKYADDYDKIVKSLLPDMKKIINDEVVKLVEAELKRLHELPLRYWKGGQRGEESQSSKRKRYSKPTIDIKKKVEVLYQKPHVRVRIKFEITLKDGGAVHKLYYWLDRGTPGYTMQNNSAWFPPRPINRTIPNSLDVRPEPGYAQSPIADGYINENTRARNGILYKRIRAGQTRQGIEARNWSKIIAKKTNTYINSFPGNWTFTYDLNNPF